MVISSNFTFVKVKRSDYPDRLRHRAENYELSAECAIYSDIANAGKVLILTLGHHLPPPPPFAILASKRPSPALLGQFSVSQVLAFVTGVKIHGDLMHMHGKHTLVCPLDNK